MTADGTWSGATGKADDVRDVGVDDQFAIASVTKTVVAAQVMQMVEAGGLDLDDPAADHLPADLDFDTNGATIRHLLGQRSGIPDYYPAVHEMLSTDRLRVWTPADLLELVTEDRGPPGEYFAYTDTNLSVARTGDRADPWATDRRGAARRRPPHRGGRATHLSTG